MSSPEDEDQAEIQGTWPNVPGQRTQHADVSSSLSPRAQEAPRNSQLMVLSQGDIMVRESAHSGYQEQHEYSFIPELLRLPPGRMGCPRCIVLQTEVASLKKRLAIMESLVEKLREFCN
ncbi:uncharacterized protein CXorf49 homolog [Sorex araneus]|uniref:uncharacterized protein CXorf49 homolog n=1 Tax=Sorex araneus TaxID=42254 RepID=UPI0024333764|nr:uncharacterized protein CXorf49 homolog [Sorex araneus]